MLYLKLLIGVVSILLFTKIGKNKSNKYKKSYLFWSSVNMFIGDFKGDLLYKKSKLEDFLDRQYSAEEFTVLLNSLVNNEELEFPDFLDLEDKIDLNNFFLCLGKTDTTSQIDVINSFKEKFSMKMIEKYNSYKKYFSLSTKIGFIVGLAFMIMVI